MIDYTNTQIAALSVHFVGNKTNEAELFLSKKSLAVDESVHDLLLKYFLSGFHSPEYFCFAGTKSNEVYSCVKEVFDTGSSLHLQSIKIASFLYETSLHPNIKDGELFVAYFPEIVIEDEVTNAIGIFKCETLDPFLKLDREADGFSLNSLEGINIEKLDKGCLIFNTNKETGYKVQIVDKAGKSGGEAQFWKNDFLQLEAMNDTFHQTKNFIGLTKSFVSNRLSEDFEVSPVDQADYMNRSKEYFQNNDHFDERKFAKQVFNDSAVIESFTKYKNDFADDKGIDIESEFSISDVAVKKEAGIFKSVVKLDKNFSIYIHGKREMVEKGVEHDGRKFYKFYYNEEHQG